MNESLDKLIRRLTVGLTFPLIFLNGWLLLSLAEKLQPLVGILIAATLIAFLLDYPIRFIEQRGLKRGLAASGVLLIFFLILTTLILFLGPLIWQQANELVIRLPEWLKSGQKQLNNLNTWVIDQQLPFDVTATVNQFIEKLTSLLRSLTSQLIGFTFTAIGSLVNILLTLVFTIFIVLRGESLWNGILSWISPQWSQQIRESLPQNFERYIVGQFTLATILAISQTTALLILRIPLAQLFGLGIGVASLIPLGGTSTIIVVSFLLALQNFWLGFKVLITAVIVTQLVENVIGPRIVGELTGLNPVWMLISLDLGVKVGGPLGLLVAVPIASFIKISFDMIRSPQTLPSVPILTPEISGSGEVK